MDSLHTGCKNRELIFIENEILCLYIKGSPKHPNLVIQPDEKKDVATYQVQCRESLKIEIDGVSTGEGKACTYYLQPLFYEQQSYEILIENKQGKKITFDHAQINIREQVSYIGRSQKMMSGVLNFKNEIGYTDLRIKVEDEWYLTLTLEIFPSKMSYKADYQALLHDVNQDIYNLSLDFLKSTYTTGEQSKEKQPSLTEFYTLLRSKFEALMRAAKIIVERPHHELGVQTYIGKPKAKYLSNTQSFNYLRKHPQYVVQQQGQFVPTKALHVIKEATYNTRENQLVKYWLKKLLMKVEKIDYCYNQLNRRSDESVLQELARYKQRLKGILRAPFFNDVAEPQVMPNFSLVLQMAPGYREMYKLYVLLMRSLSLLEGQYQISTKNVAELYEYWCFIKLGVLLRCKYELQSQDLIKVDHRGIFVVLKKGQASKLTFKHPVTKETFCLKYNAKGTTLPTVNQKPDNILELKKEMTDVTYKYIFDAKYKVNYKEAENEVYARPTEEDINTMHRYRDAIVYETNQRDYERTVFGAFVLFPGNNEEDYQKDGFYTSIDKVGIGGFPFLPSTYTLVEEFLEQLIEGSGHSHYKGLPNQQGMRKYVEDEQIEIRNVLVGPTRSEEQIEGIKKHQLYHIPLRNVRNHFMQVEYVAIYESKREQWQGGIRYYGKVEKVEIKRRKQLLKYFPTERDNLDEDYVVYRIGALIPLKASIMAKGYGVPRCMYTSKVLLDYGTTIPELSIKNQEEFNLYLAIKRASEAYGALDQGMDKQYVAQVGERKFYIEGTSVICELHKGREEIQLEQFFKNPKKILSR